MSISVGRDWRRRDQRTTRTGEMEERVWYQPFVQLSHPLMTPAVSTEQQFVHFDRLRLSGANQFIPGHTVQTPAGFLGSKIPEQMISQQSVPMFRRQHAIASNHSQEEQSKVISMDEDITLHGNWTIANANFRLLCFCDAIGDPEGYVYFEMQETNKTMKQKWVYCCKKNLYLEQLDKMIKGEGKGQTRAIATNKCALSLIQHLYQLEMIEEHIAPMKLRKKIDFQIERYKIVVYKISIDKKLEHQIDQILKAIKIIPIKIQIPPKLPSREKKPNPVILRTRKPLTVSAIASFGTPNIQPNGLPQWSPPFKCWDPWLNRRITDGTLSDMSMEEIGSDLRFSRLRQLECDNTAQDMLNARLKLPIFSSIGKINDAIQNNPVVIIQGPNGCGKSTQVPQYILDTYINAGCGGECSIMVIQPRRISTVNIAERIAQERGEPLGISCGYSIRFDSCLPRPYGSILFCTADVVLKKLKSGLRGISHVIVDEIHERDINVDFILLVLREMVRICYNLHIILLSAPMEMTLFCEYFFNCPVIEVGVGPSYPVTDFYLEDCIELVKFVPPSKVQSSRKDSDDEYDDEKTNEIIGENYLKTTRDAMSKMREEEIPFELIEVLLMNIQLQNVPGAILIFLPSWGVISKLMSRFQKHHTLGGPCYLILTLHSQLSWSEVQRVFQTAPAGVRKIILSTGIGESGITINDVVYVIDSCKMKMKNFTSHDLYFNSTIMWASKRNLEQRRGRIGRTQAGTCFRLCSRARFDRLKDNMPAAMSYTPLDELALAIKFLGVGNVYHVLSRALEPPPLYLIIQAETLLREIGATDPNGGLTSLGTILGQLPIRPQLGKMLILSCLFRLGDPFCTIVPRAGICLELFNTTSFQQASHARQHFQGNHCSDFITLLNAYTQWEKVQSFGKHAGSYFCEEFCLSQFSMEIIRNARRQLRGILQAAGFSESCLCEYDYTSSDSDILLDTLSALLLEGYYPNICYYNIRTKEILVNGSVATVDSLSLYNVKEAMQFSRSPFFVYEERIGTKIECKEMTMVTPLQLLLFGRCQIEILDGIVVLDGWIKLKMDLDLVSKLMALRRGIDKMLLHVTYNPSLADSFEELKQLADVVKQLCSRNAIVRKEL